MRPVCSAQNALRIPTAPKADNTWSTRQMCQVFHGSADKDHVIVLALVAAMAAPASGHVRADYPNQAAAQKAADTRDSDGDGIYCESLPCPCLKPGTKVTTQSVVGGLGRSILFGRVTKHSGCRARRGLPDRRCTPGARFRRVTKPRVCRSGYSEQVRNVSESAKDRVYAAYGRRRHFDGANGEVDHLVPLELGGSNARANLFPQRAPYSHEKDQLENALHADVCAGRLPLRRAQRLIARNWARAYRQRF